MAGERGLRTGDRNRAGGPAGRAGGTAAWLESWVATQVHDSAGADLAERARHERFIVARSVAAAVTLAALPPFLIWRGVPSTLESLALLALVVPLAAVALLSRCGGLVQAQALASGAVMPLAASLCAALGGPAGPGALVLLALPFEAVTAGSKRGFLAAFAMTGLSVPLALALTQAVPLAAPAECAAVGGAVALVLAFSHALAALAVDLRLAALVRMALRAGEAREGATLQAIDDLVTWHDRNGLVLRANAASARLLGVPPAALQGRGLFARVLVADRPAFVKAISDASMTDEPVSVRLRIGAVEAGTRTGAPVLWVEMRAHRLRGGSASVVAMSRTIPQEIAERDAPERSGAGRMPPLRAGEPMGIGRVPPPEGPPAGDAGTPRVHRLRLPGRPGPALQPGMIDVA